MMLLLFACSSTEEPAVKSTLGSEEKAEADDAGETKEPVKEKTVEERNAEFAKAAEGWKARQKELQSQQAQKDGLKYTTTKPLFYVDQKKMAAMKKNAEKGHAESQYNMGMYYKYGLGVKQDNNKSLYWFKKASDQGHMKARRVYLFMLRR